VFKSILIANRGEIALRIIWACRELIDLLIEKDVSELAIEREGVKVKIRRGGVEVSAPATPVQHIGAAPAAASGHVGVDETAPATGFEDCHIVTSPMVGTFYRAPEPDADPFTDIGEQIAEGETLCIVEAMKLMNEIVAEVGGDVVAVFVEDNEPVEFGQHLFAIRPRG